jgi:hypothetical protein
MDEHHRLTLTGVVIRQRHAVKIRSSHVSNPASAGSHDTVPHGTSGTPDLPFQADSRAVGPPSDTDFSAYSGARVDGQRRLRERRYRTRTRCDHEKSRRERICSERRGFAAHEWAHVDPQVE